MKLVKEVISDGLDPWAEGNSEDKLSVRAGRVRSGERPLITAFNAPAAAPRRDSRAFASQRLDLARVCSALRYYQLTLRSALFWCWHAVLKESAKVHSYIQSETVTLCNQKL